MLKQTRNGHARDDDPNNVRMNLLISHSASTAQPTSVPQNQVLLLLKMIRILRSGAE